MASDNDLKVKASNSGRVTKSAGPGGTVGSGKGRGKLVTDFGSDPSSSFRGSADAERSCGPFKDVGIGGMTGGKVVRNTD